MGKLLRKLRAIGLILGLIECLFITGCGNENFIEVMNDYEKKYILPLERDIKYNHDMEVIEDKVSLLKKVDSYKIVSKSLKRQFQDLTKRTMNVTHI